MERTLETRTLGDSEEVWRSEAVCDVCHVTLMTMTGSTKMSLTAVKCPKDSQHSVVINTHRVYP